MARSFLRQIAQIKKSALYDDTLYMPGAESSGVNLEDDLNFIRTQLVTILGETNWYDAPAATVNELNAWIGAESGRIDTANDNIDNASGMIDDIQSAMGMTDGDTTLTYTSTNYIGATDTVELAISTLDEEAGTLASGVADNVANIATASGDIDNLQLFCGAADGDTTPTYSSDTWATGTLEDAIGELDAALTITSGLVGEGFTLEDRVSEVLDYEWPVASGERTLPQSKEYIVDDYDGKYLQVYLNGQLLLCGSGADNEYSESSTTGITFNFDLVSDDILQYTIFS